MFNNFSLFGRRFVPLALCSLLLATTACQKESGVAPSPSGASVTQAAHGSNEPVNKGKYLAFASSADFLATAKQLDQLEAGESSTNHLEKWEQKYGFYSLRAHYAKKRKEKEKKEEQQGALASQNASDGTTQSQLIPVEGETPTELPYEEPYFEPYSEPWDEGLIIEDDYFAAMLSPDGTVQIEGKLFHLDLANNIVSYIPATSTVGTQTTYEEFVAADPTVANNEIRYFSMEEDVLDVIEAGDTGTAFGEARITISSGIGCGLGAKGKDDPDRIYYMKDRRLNCKLVYQHLGIYHSIVAKAHNQKQTWYNAWLGSPADLIIQTRNAVWRPKCQDFNNSDFNTYDNYSSPWLGDENGDNNTVTHRYYSSTKGLKSFKISIQFQVNARLLYTTRVFSIEGAR